MAPLVSRADGPALLARLRRRWQRVVAGEQGFTLIELVVAMLVISGVLLGLLATQVRSLGTVGLAQERQTATAFANRYMEQVRALPYSQLQGGLDCTDLSSGGDSDISYSAKTGGCTATFHPAYDSSISESVVTSASGAVAPLKPHVHADSSTSVLGVQYRLRVYVTYAVGTDPASGFWVTVTASWKSAASGQRTTQLATRSLAYSAQDCLLQTTHPFSGPCQPSLYTDAGDTSASIQVQSTRSGQTVLDGLDVTSATTTLAGIATRTQVEQTTSAQSSASRGAATLVGATSGTQSACGQAGTVQADNDPSSAGVTSAPASAVAPGTCSSGSLTQSGSSGSSFALAADTGGSGSAYATTAAASSPACPDTAATPVSTANGLVCASSSMSPATDASAALTLSSSATSAMTLADFAPAGSASRAWGQRFAATAASHCLTASGAGCVAASVTRALGTLVAGGLPRFNGGDHAVNASGTDVTSTLGSTPLVKVTGYSDSAAAESGTGAGTSSPQVAVTRSGSIAYWNGTAFTTVSLGSGAQTLTVPAVTATYSGGTTVVVSGTVTVSASGTTTTGASPCQSAACSTTSSSGGVTVQLTYAVYTGSGTSGTQVGGFTVTADLGSALAKTSYKAAASG